jgi:hypothetical protein
VRQSRLPFFPLDPQFEASTSQVDTWTARNGCPYRFTPLFFQESDPAPASAIDRTMARVAVALLERGTPLARVIDLLPMALIAAGIYLALW